MAGKPGKSSKSPHHLTNADSSRGGKKSRRGPGRSASIKAFLQKKPPKEVLDLLKAKHGLKTINAKTYADLLDSSLFAEALSGSIMAHKEINDRSDGKAEQKVNLDADITATFKVEWPKKK